MTTGGDQTGTFNAIGDYSSTSDDFYVQPPAAEDYMISSLDITIVDDRINPEGYGAMDALTNGVSIVTVLQGVTYIAGAGTNITSNRGWMSISDDVQYVDWGLPIEEKMMRCRIDFGKFYADPQRPQPDGVGGLMLLGHTEDKLIIRLNDDFTDLSGHYFIVRGGRYSDHISSKNQG